MKCGSDKLRYWTKDQVRRTLRVKWTKPESRTSLRENPKSRRMRRRKRDEWVCKTVYSEELGRSTRTIHPAAPWLSNVSIFFHSLLERNREISSHKSPVTIHPAEPWLSNVSIFFHSLLERNCEISSRKSPVVIQPAAPWVSNVSIFFHSLLERNREIASHKSPVKKRDLPLN